MIRVPFEVELAKRIQNGECEGRIVTRDGRRVRIVCWDRKDVEFPIVALIDNAKNGEGFFCHWWSSVLGLGNGCF